MGGAGCLRRVALVAQRRSLRRYSVVIQDCEAHGVGGLVSRLTPGGGVQPHENKPQEGGVLLGLLLSLMQHNRWLHAGRFTHPMDRSTTLPQLARREAEVSRVNLGTPGSLLRPRSGRFAIAISACEPIFPAGGRPIFFAGQEGNRAKASKYLGAHHHGAQDCALQLARREGPVLTAFL